MRPTYGPSQFEAVHWRFAPNGKPLVACYPSRLGRVTTVPDMVTCSRCRYVLIGGALDAGAGAKA